MVRASLCCASELRAVHSDLAEVMVTSGKQTRFCTVRREKGAPPSYDLLCFRYVWDASYGRFRPVGELGELTGAPPTPATHASLTQVKAGETMYHADKLLKTL